MATDASTEPTATVEAKSTLDILAKDRKPYNRTTISTVAMINTQEAAVFKIIGRDAVNQFSIKGDFIVSSAGGRNIV